MIAKPYIHLESDYVSRPGETILELLEHHGLTQLELARRMGRPQEQISRLVNGKIGIEPDTAIQLERTLGMSATFWMNLDSNYREHLARFREKERLSSQVGWLDSIPWRDMVKLQWIPPIERDANGVRKVLDFFGVATPGQFSDLWMNMPVAARQSKSYQSDLGAVATWLRFGQRCAMNIKIPPYNVKSLQGNIAHLRSLTKGTFATSMQQAIDLCNTCGVVVIFVREVTGMRFNGAVQWLGNKPIMQLTTRHKRADIIWFSFFHELAHILHHPRNEVFIEEPAAKSVYEAEADSHAQEWLISERAYKSIDLSDVTPAVLQKIAHGLGVGPDVFVGRLLREGRIHYSKNYTKMLRPVSWDDVKSMWQSGVSARSI